MSDHSLNFNATHLHLPGWWVHAFEVAHRAEGESLSAMQQAYAAGLAPALGSLELNSLAMVLASLQEQILRGDYQNLWVRAEEHLKHAGTIMRTRRFIFEKIVQLLVGLRLLTPTSDASMRSFSPVAADRWRRLSDDDAFELGVSLNPLGAELLLGLSDAHSDLVRFASGQTEAHTLLRGLAPLTVWRSIWLELAGMEQLLYLRLERGMQWEFRWLQLEGIFGIPLGELFASMSIPEQRGVELASELAKRLRVINKLGRKLVDQGFMASTVQDQYLAFGGPSEHRPTGPMMVWQASRERLASDATHAYRRAAAHAIVQGWFGDSEPLLLQLCFDDATVGSVAPIASGMWRELAKIPADRQPMPLDVQPGQILLPQALFYEYCLRSHPACLWPLPSGVAGGPLGELIRDPRAPDLVVRFEKFWAYVESDLELQQALNDEPMMTLSSAATRGVIEVATALRQRLTTRPDTTTMMVSPSEAKPRLIAQVPAASSREPTAQVNDKPLRPAAVSGALAARMMKTASEELAKMRASDLTRYEQLKKAFFASLDDTSRKLLLDVQKRIQPNLFDEQLRQRLVRFMVENPGSWRSADVSRTSNN
ncbi:MAG: hypothetical protein FJ146_04945 [Deltaproteobacteria bacterium]|nr:hypothetical protein [Deltaproteobacteria bacterium]